MVSDPHNLQRFIDAQKSMYDKALAELKAGKKRGHWMWFIFPQTLKPNMSQLSKQFAINSKEEAHAYLVHPVLGNRLLECTEAVLTNEEKSLKQIFGTELDAMKFISCMRLFGHVGGEGSIFGNILRNANNELFTI